MCLFFAVAAAVATVPAAPKARATLRVMKPAAVSEQLWRAREGRKERIIMDEQGRQLRLRLIEYE